MKATVLADRALLAARSTAQLALAADTTRFAGRCQSRVWHGLPFLVFIAPCNALGAVRRLSSGYRTFFTIVAVLLTPAASVLPRVAAYAPLARALPVADPVLSGAAVDAIFNSVEPQGGAVATVGTGRALRRVENGVSVCVLANIARGAVEMVYVHR